jgi:glycosyltransferase involved in cell wall biosynthesis
MRIIYIHQYFLTPEEGGAVRSFHLAKGLVKAGFHIDLITAHNKDYYDINDIYGFRVHYLPVNYENEYGFFHRLWAFWDFVRSAKKLMTKLQRPELLYVTSTPLTTGLIGLWAKKKYALPYVFEVRDLWPEAPIRVGVIRNPLLKRILYRLEEKIYQGASTIVALSPAIKNHIALKVPEKKIEVIPNFADTDFFYPEYIPKRIPAFDRKKNIKVVYAGALGFVNGLDQLMKLANEAKNLTTDWQFVLMGKGSALTKLKHIAKNEGLTNVQFMDFGDKEVVREVLADADLVYLSFLPVPILGTGSPNKFFDALAMGKPVILNFGGWVKDLVVRNKIGFFHQLGEETALIKEIETFRQSSNDWSKMQNDARKLAEHQYSKKIAVKKLITLLKPFRRKEPASGAYNRIA